MTATLPNLFGLSGSERAYDDPASAYESEIEPLLDGDQREWEIEECTSFTAATALCSADRLVGWVVEGFGDGDYAPLDYGATAERIESDPEVEAAAEAFLAVVASKINYRWCDELVATHILTLGEDGAPLLDGEPLYGKRPPEADEAPSLMTVTVTCCTAVHPRTGRRCESYVYGDEPHHGPAGAEHWHRNGGLVGRSITTWPLGGQAELELTP